MNVIAYPSFSKMPLLDTIGSFFGKNKPRLEKKQEQKTTAPPSAWELFSHAIYSTHPSLKTEADLQFYRKTQNSMLDRNVKTVVDGVQTYLDMYALKPEGNGQRSFGEVYFQICNYLWNMYTKNLRPGLNDVVLTLAVKKLREQCYENNFDTCIAVLWERTRLAAMKKAGLSATTCGSDMSLKFERKTESNKSIQCSAPKTIFKGWLANDPQFTNAWPYFPNGQDFITTQIGQHIRSTTDDVSNYFDESANAGSLYLGGRKRTQRQRKPSKSPAKTKTHRRIFLK
jgi:hypothetical protein